LCSIDAIDVAGKINRGDRIVGCCGLAVATVRWPPASASLTGKLAHIATWATTIVFAIDLGKIWRGCEATRENRSYYAGCKNEGGGVHRAADFRSH
jgi:hypothetical protein